MNAYRIQQFRIAAFIEDIVENVCWSILAENRWEIGSGTAQIAKLIDPRRRIRSFWDDDFSLHPTDSHASLMQTMILWLVDEMRILQLGSSQGFYPVDAYAQVLNHMQSLEEELSPVVALLREIEQFWRIGLFSPPRSRSFDEVYDDVVSLQANWRNTSTDEFHECVKLLVFADESEWARRIGQLGQLAQRMVEDPSLSLTAEEADDVAWGLQGASFVFDDTGDGIQWSTTFAVVQESAEANSIGRPRQLQTARESIADAAKWLTMDQSAAALRSWVYGPRGWTS